jgi:NAD(P)-dependent dehydrogenase (short-subunit alcohol dehydrogenase family)
MVPMTARPTAEALRKALETLEAIAEDHGLLALLPEDERTRFRQAAGAVFLPDAKARRRLSKEAARRRKAEAIARDEEVLGQTGIRSLRRQSVFTTPNVYPPREHETPRTTEEAQHCYVCHQPYTVIHHFYDQLCPDCGDFNFGKRVETANLAGKVALVTGGRVKIGYQAVIKLLRAGAHVIVSTRFPRDAAVRFAKEPDYDSFAGRLEIFGLDLRHSPSVEAFARYLLDTHARLDYIINNACQTVRRPPEYYSHMMERERAALAEMPPAARALLTGYEALRSAAAGLHPRDNSVVEAGLQPRDSSLVEAGLQPRDSGHVEAGLQPRGLLHAAELSQLALLPEDEQHDVTLFPAGTLDQDLQQVDLRDRNSWRLLLAEVSTVEMLEVQLVNAVAPFILNARLKPLMLRTPDRDKHIVNVSAVEGQFYRPFKTTKHPHTNMAKAALNMMTRTSAADYHADGIHMNSVDTGWVTDEDPEAIAARKTAEQRFHPPLDIVDGAARIVDPIVVGANTGEHVWGQFLKDYKSTDW